MMIFPIEQLPYYQNWAFREKFFSPEECDRALTLVNAAPLQDVLVRRDDASAPGSELRRSRVSVVPWIKEVEWICQRLAAAVLECNKSLYNFHLTGLVENLQIDQYQAGAFFDWHQDFAFREASLRKLNVIVQLSDGSQYEGGDVEFFAGRGAQKAIRSKGALLIFPSFVTHRITPVTAGTRHAIAAWISGPPFR
jgi:PKHD-type hydroxylase